MEERKSFGKFIREKRLEKGYSQQQLAERLFVSESAISKWERGINYPDITIISDICKVLDISEHELVTASNDTEYRQLKKDANTFRKINKVSFMSCVIVYAVALVVCFICNLAVDHTLSWFWIVLGSILCAFSFFPTYSRFFTKDKFLYFLLTSMVSVILLLLICGIYTKTVDWVPVASASVLLGYVLLFMPALMKRYRMPYFIEKAKFLFYVLLLMVLTVLVLFAAAILTDFAVKKAILLTVYCYAPFILMGIGFIFESNRMIRTGISVLLIGLAVFGASQLGELVFDPDGIDHYRVDFTDWLNFSNGNVNFIILITTLVAGISLLIIGIVKKSKEAKQAD